MKLHSVLFSLTAVAFLAAGACSSDDTKNTTADAGETEHDHDYDIDANVPPNCEKIKDACHPLDTGEEGPIHTCHELAHDGTDETCAAKLDECLATCKASDAG